MLVFVLNCILFAVTVWAYVGCFRTPEGGWSVRQGLGALRFFTLLSNLFCALAALLMAVGILLGGVKLAVLALCAFGLVGMWAAVFADVGVMFLAVLNALRLLRKAKI